MNKLGLASLFAAALLAAAPLTGCSDDDNHPDNETVITVSELPRPAQEFLLQNYPSTNVVRVERETDSGVVIYDVTLGNGHEVTFNSKGEWVEVDAPDGQSVPASVIPANILSYLDTYYQGYGVNDITRTGYGFEVELTTGLDLRFDQTGNFLGVDND